MSDQNKDGGPAFPQSENYRYDSGMRLRDYLAAHAPEVPDMQTFPIKQWKDVEIVNIGGGKKKIADVFRQETWAQRNARWAVEYADALLAELSK